VTDPLAFRIADLESALAERTRELEEARAAVGQRDEAAQIRTDEIVRLMRERDEAQAALERLRAAPWPGQANIVLAAYRAAEADPHCEVPHEDMAELIDRTVRENAALRSELSALRADAERIAQYHTSDGYCTWCHRLDRDHWSDCPTAVARTALAAAGGGSGT